METNKIYNLDCIEGMKLLDDNSIDSIVTDPPYELGFMGKSWDNSSIAYNIEMWKEAMRVLKPGGYLLSFGGTRTYHRMACAIEDAGFEIRDQIQWVYGSGFPKSLNIGKAIDKIAPRLGQFDKFAEHFKQQRELKQISQKDIAKHFLSKTSGITGCVWNWENGANIPTLEQWNKLKELLDLSNEFLPLIERIERERKIIGKSTTNKTVYQRIGQDNISGEINVTKGTSEWEGWGTALKPANEPICVARKPLAEKTVAENVLKYGTGGINIDECKVPISNEDIEKRSKEEISRNIEKGKNNGKESITGFMGLIKSAGQTIDSIKCGRFPSNVLHDGSEEVMNEFAKAGVSKSNDSKRNRKVLGSFGMPNDSTPEYSDSGTPARFFYCAKASKSERNQGLDEFEEKRKCNSYSESREGMYKDRNTLLKNNHPTVKPLKLMQYLVRLVTPKNGIVLDPFIGSGTTGMAAKSQGFNYIGFDMTKEYCDIAEARIKSINGQKRLF